MKFYSDMSEPDPRWKTRHTPTPDLPAADFAPKYKDGRLILRLREREDQVYTSHLATEEAFQFGRFRARMRFPSGKGAHSAFWLQDVVPNSLGGSEVDIIEHFGSDAIVWHNVYWRTPETLWPKEPTRWRQSKAIDPREWHVYGVDWHPDQYIFSIDGKVSAVSNVGISSMPKVMILSLLSSKWEWPNLRRDELDTYRTVVDWVKVYDL